MDNDKYAKNVEPPTGLLLREPDSAIPLFDPAEFAGRLSRARCCDKAVCRIGGQDRVPYCDACVCGHNVAALGEVIDVIADPTGSAGAATGTAKRGWAGRGAKMVTR